MPDLGLAPLLYAARPGFRVDGADKPELREALQSLTVEETRDGLVRAEASFAAWGTTGGETDVLWMDRALLEFGKGFEITMGDGPLAARVFKGRISGLEGRFPASRPPVVAALAEDRLLDLRMTRRTRVFEEIDDAGLFARIAQDHGLTPEIDVDGPQHRALAQINLSDLAFLRERARAVDAEIWLDDTTLHVQARARRDAGRVELTWGRGLHEFQALADLATQRTALAVGGWDVAAAEAIEARAGASVVASDPGAGESGPALLETAFGAREERLVHLAPATADEAQAAADAEMARRARRFLTGRGIAEGDPRIRVGATLALRGLGPLFDGDWYVAATRHEFDGEAGFRTVFDAERAKLGA